MKTKFIKSLILALLVFNSNSIFSQTKFVTQEANFIYDYVKSKGSATFDKEFEKTFKEKGFVIDDDMIFINVAEALKEEKLANEAISVFKVGTKHFPKIIMLWNGLGEAYLINQNKKDAKICFEKVLKLKPGNPRAQEGLKKCE